jgi:hypothetical protein
VAGVSNITDHDMQQVIGRDGVFTRFAKH